jgi:NAD-dependent dihydropyrimidine dehydrogenase PreA subunit
MQGLRYLEEAVTLSLDAEKCNGCRMCTLVCPHAVFAIGADKKAFLADRGACMECGACALNCATGAITVEPGVGCAAAIINGWLTGTEPSCGCGEGEPAGGGCCSSSGPVSAPEKPAAAGCGCGDDSSAPSDSCCAANDSAPAATESCCGGGSSKSGCC